MGCCVELWEQRRPGLAAPRVSIRRMTTDRNASFCVEGKSYEAGPERVAVTSLGLV